MSKFEIREDKSCLNCGTYVDKTYCPRCGQPNKESRESFPHLIFEFVGDLLHFDSSFWKTGKYLLFSPAKLSLEYMVGKRKSYVNPIKLFIFLSFIAFFLPNVLPTPSQEQEKSPELVAGQHYIKKYDAIISSLSQLDSVNNMQPERERLSEKKYASYKKLLEQDAQTLERENKLKETLAKDPELDSLLSSYDILPKSESKNIDQSNWSVTEYGNVNGIEQLDSIHSSKSKEEQISLFKYYFHKTMLQVNKNGNDEQAKRLLANSVVNNLPKVLFVLLPIFAFWMWLFNLNRRRHYFDSCIFTLHFFSFWLLMISIFMIISNILLDWLNYPVIAYAIILPLILLYITYYFFRANRIYYKEKKWLATLKSMLLFVINTICIVAVLILYILFMFSLKYN